MNRRMLYLVIGLAAAGLLMHRAASSQPATASKPPITYFPNRAPQAAYSSAVLVGDTLYVGGVIGLDQRTGQPPARVEDEIKNVLEAYKIILGRAGFVMDDLVDVQVYCTDLAYGEKFNAAYRTYFSKQLPARAFVGVNALIGGGHLEMKAIAVRH